jgi:hypothetical protein
MQLIHLQLALDYQKALTASSSHYVDSHIDNGDTDNVFEDYFHDINEAIEYR